MQRNGTDADWQNGFEINNRGIAGKTTMTTFISNIVQKAAKAVMLGAAIGAMSLSAHAQTPNPIKQHKAWGAYSYQDAKAGKICYILSIPTIKEPADRDHGEVFFLISQKPNGATGYEPQVEVGYPLKDDSTVTVDVDGKKFAMFSQGNNAWLKDLSTEPDLVAAMRAGSRMKVSGESRRGTQTTYTYSLACVTAALSEGNNCK